MSEPDHDPAILCPDCGCYYHAAERRCQNPACFPGLAAYRAAYAAWESARDTWIAQTRARHAGSGCVFVNLHRDYTDRHPAPLPVDYRPR